MVEDNAADVYLIRRALKAAFPDADPRVMRDGEEAVRLIDQIDSDHRLPAPAIMLLDVNLPKKHGAEVLEHIRRSSRCARTIVVAVSTSNAPRDREALSAADHYFHKPSGLAEFMKLGDLVKSLLAGKP